LTDIFISFAHINDKPTYGETQGWISQFFHNLRTQVDSQMGREDSNRWWKDFRLKGSDEVTPAIEAELAEIHFLVIMLSPGWIASDWCQRELRVFSNRIPSPNGRVFVVEMDCIDKTEQPAILRDLLGYRFWQKTEQDRLRRLKQTDPDYQDAMGNLSDHLVQALKAKKQRSEQIQAPSTQATVYVPSVNRALAGKRAKLISEFAQFGIAALPLENRWDETTVAADLARCSYFVQLLDDDDAMGIPCKQFALAQAVNKPIVQWRDPDLNCSDADIPVKHRQLLEGKTVIAAALSDFNRMAREKILPKQSIDSDQNGKSKKEMVFVHATPADIDRAHGVAKQLKSAGYNIALPRYEGDADAVHRTIERGYQYCNALLMVHQTASAAHVEESLSEAFCELQKRQPVPPPMMICQGDAAEELYFTPPDTHTFTCGDRFEARCLEQFLAEVAHGK
jgi:hypothetical protein